MQLAKHHTRCTLNWTAEAGRERKERGRIEDGREGGGSRGRVEREGATGGREEAMMRGSVGAGVEEGREG